MRKQHYIYKPMRISDIKRTMIFYLYEEFAEALAQNYKHTWDWLVTRFHDKVDIAMFTTGFGDGMYPSFWGIDQNGEPTCLVTDFFIMD
ncbi:DUF4241 domain-containing protein [Bacillus sp. NMCC46]|nr:DUF4241 domain-containing protein [Bacillus pumilus]PAC82086.1 hypothetical protein CHI05_08485 [Bacillus sp. 7788]PRS43890.1 DUF4241 domain-containing protein [Bacillus sp. NMCC46]PRS49189.1 DUF4241 domain-containing protein [Bacillus sp. LNXM10]PRS56585.1 DUF4241 domain-containing protein [Bacillus sp. GBSC66]PRS61905.1 DUF4241 domain-containing protein [Bacillus sp. GBSW19]PRS72572.1 DUF4241 domain-containing protein [Bacillus sp. LNXM65]